MPPWRCSSSKVDRYADPKVQIQQAIEEAPTHQGLDQQAASVRSATSSLHSRCSSTASLANIEKLQVAGAPRWPIRPPRRVMRPRPPSTPTPPRPTRHGEQSVEVAQDPARWCWALQAAGQAKKAIKQNSDGAAQNTASCSASSSKPVQEQVSASLPVDERHRRTGTPSLDEVRDKMEHRYATRWAPPSWPQTRAGMMEIQQASVQMAGHSRLEQSARR